MSAKIKLIMGCDDPNFNILTSHIEQEDRMKHRRNFWEDILQIPCSVTYNTNEDTRDARNCHKRWSMEFYEKK